jgi:hypothetical protein
MKQIEQNLNLTENTIEMRYRQNEENGLTKSWRNRKKAGKMCEYKTMNQNDCG